MENQNRNSFNINLQGDFALWVFTILLIGLGSLVVYSASSALALTKGESTEIIFMKHLVNMGLGVASMFFFSKINYRYLGALSTVLMIVSFLLMLLVTFTSAAVTINDASRWLRVPLIGLTFQPSDIAKLSVMIYLSSSLSRLQNSVDKFWAIFIRSVFLPMLVIGLIAINNVSTALLLTLLLAIMLFVARVKINVFGGLFVLVLLAMPVLYFASHRTRTAISRISDYIKTDEEGVGISELPYQVEQANIALARGGINGVGLGHSQQRYFLPEAFSDYIYAIIIEEHGFKFGLLILVLFLAIFYRAMKITQKTTNPFAGLLTTSLGLMIVIQALIHMGVVTGLFPVTGLTLPWISVGGTSILFTGMAFGIILNVSKETQQA
jgi:cell division protein FtsW